LQCSNNGPYQCHHYALHVAAVTDYTEKSSERTTLVGQLTTEAAKRTVVLSGIKSGTDRQTVEQLAGNLKRVRQVRYPVVMHDGASDLCAAFIYRGKQDALKAVRRLKSQKLSGFIFTFSVCS